MRKFGAQCSFLALQFVNKEDQGAKNTSCYQVEDLSINGNQTNFTILFNSAIKEFPLVVGPLTWVPGGEDLLCAAMQGHPSRAE